MPDFQNLDIFAAAIAGMEALAAVVHFFNYFAGQFQPLPATYGY